MNASFEPKKQKQGQYSPRNESQSAISYPSRTLVHAKLEMTEPGDHDEQEADAVANAVVNGGKIARKISHGAGGSSGIAVSPQMESQLSQLQGGGRQMPQGLRNMMESGFGRDFSQVRLHTDGEAACMSNSIHAKAFTHGNDIYFNRGQFAPETAEGQHLVAHELTHVVQGTGKVGRDFNPIFGNKNTVQNVKAIDDEFLKNVLLDAKSLAKEMVSKSIDVLTQMKNDGKHLSLFYYCFDRKKYLELQKGKRPAIPRSKIDAVIKNYQKILDVLNNDDILKSDNPSLTDQKIQFKLTKEWNSIVIKQLANDERLKNAGGFAYQGGRNLNRKLIELAEERKKRQNPPPGERRKLVYDPSAITETELNTVFLRFTDDSDYFIKKIEKEDRKDGNNYEYNWSHRLRLASTIIHELSHRVCGTTDHSYLNTREDNVYRKDDADLDLTTVNLIMNASSYEVFSAWVESSIYSVFDAEFNNNSNGDWSMDKSHYTDHGIPYAP